MTKTVISYFKLPVLISIVLAIVIMALVPVRLPIQATQIILGTLIGTFVLDSEYLLYSFLLEPKQEFSLVMTGFIKHRDITNVINHIKYHKDQIADKSLNSGLFQAVLAVLSIFVVSATSSLFAKAFVLSILASSLYKLAESYFEGTSNDWFWAFKTKPTKSGTKIFFGIITAVLAFCLFLI